MATATVSAPPTRRAAGRPGWLATPLPWLAGLLVLYLLVPVAGFLDRLARHPGQLSVPGLGGALAVSAETATITTCLVAVVGLPLAYLLSRTRGRLGGLVTVAVALPLALPPLMSGLLLLSVVGPYTTLGRLLGGRLTDDLAGIVLAQAFVAAPFLVIAARSAFAAVDPALDDVAATLGYGRTARLVRVALPVARHGVVAGLLLTWLRAFGEFGATVVLAYHPYSLPVFAYVQFGSTGLGTTLGPVAATLAAAAAAGLLALALGRPPAPTARGRRGRRLTTRTPTEPRPPSAAGAPLDLDVTTHAGAFTVRLRHRCTGPRLAVLGPSGAGKTLALRAVAGLVRLDAGEVRMADVAISGVRPERRQVGYLPQDPALPPHLTVAEQVLFARDADPALAGHWLTRLGLDDLLGHRPVALSGGQRRRVALVRALARSPRLLLLDEPFAGLDAPVREDLRADVRRLQAETGLTTVVVSHDPADALLLADDVVVLSAGEVLQSGPVGEVVAHPVSPEVARLVGYPPARAGSVVAPGRLLVGSDLLSAATGDLEPGAPVRWCLPPGELRLGGGPGPRARVVAVARHPAATTVELEAPSGLAWTALAAGCTLAPGEWVTLFWSPDRLLVWPAG